MAVFNGVTYANGQMAALGLLRGMSGYGSQALRLDAALSFERLIADLKRTYGWAPGMTDSYRPYATQVRIFKERYEALPFGTGPFNDVRNWNGVRYVRVRGAAAAVPGTSNHGWGMAVDIGVGGFGATGFRQFDAVAARHGWSNYEGRTVNEAWHWTYSPTEDPYYSIPAKGEITTPVEDDMPLSPEDRKAIVDDIMDRFIDVNGEGLTTVPFSRLVADIATSSRAGSPQKVWEKGINGVSAESLLAAINVNAQIAAAQTGLANGVTVDTTAILEAIRGLPTATVAELKDRL